MKNKPLTNGLYFAVDKYFCVEAIIGADGSGTGWKLSAPYLDAACTSPYRAKYPERQRV